MIVRHLSLCALLILLCFGCENKGLQEEKSESANSLAETNRFSQQSPESIRSANVPPGRATEKFVGFEFAIPDGWTRVAPDRSKTKAMILLNGTAWNNAHAMVKVDVGKPVFPTVEETAKAFRGNAMTSVTIDGQHGIRISTSSADLSSPQHVVVVYRAGKAYLLMASGVRDVDVAKAFDEVLQSWHWSSAP
jgi:hypothetical protein